VVVIHNEVRRVRVMAMRRTPYEMEYWFA